jgi:hypothetical protein
LDSSIGRREIITASYGHGACMALWRAELLPNAVQRPETAGIVNGRGRSRPL